MYSSSFRKEWALGVNLFWLSMLNNIYTAPHWTREVHLENSASPGSPRRHVGLVHLAVQPLSEFNHCQESDGGGAAEGWCGLQDQFHWWAWLYNSSVFCFMTSCGILHVTHPFDAFLYFDWVPDQLGLAQLSPAQPTHPKPNQKTEQPIPH